MANEIYRTEGRKTEYTVYCRRCSRTCNNTIRYTLGDVMTDGTHHYVKCPYTSKRVYVEDPMDEVRRRLVATSTTIAGAYVRGRLDPVYDAILADRP